MQWAYRQLLALLGVLGMMISTPSFAGSIITYVDNTVGSDRYDGSCATPARNKRSGPVATIGQALKLVPVSGCISIANTGVDYRESVLVKGLCKGRAAAPLVIDGHGATVTGLLPVTADRWKPLKDDVYFFDNQIGQDPPTYGLMPNSNWMTASGGGWFMEPQAPLIFFLDGIAAPHVRTLATLPQGGFFYDIRSRPRRICFRLPAGKTLADCRIELPLNQGVFVADDDYVVVRNLASKYSQDDGFAGFWGIGVVFENCNGSYNCDQGISLHGTSVTVIDGGLYERNGGCGIADVMTSFTVYRNVTIRDNKINGALFQGIAHSLLNCRVSGNESPQVKVENDSALVMENCLLDGGNGGTGIELERGKLNHCTIVNCAKGIVVLKTAVINNSVIANCTEALVEIRPGALNATQLKQTLLWDGALVCGTERITFEGWEAFVKTAKWVDGALWANPQIEAPLYGLTQKSPYFTWGQYARTPGAVLPPWTGWPREVTAIYRRPPP